MDPNSFEIKSQVIAVLVEASSLLFGVRPEHVDSKLYSTAFLSICERFPLLTIQDIKRIYFDAQIEKKQGVGLTREELLSPIKNYYNSKLIVLNQIERIKEEEKIQENKKQEHANEAAKIYLEYLNGKREEEFPLEFAGYALTIAKESFAPYFSQDEKTILIRQAKEIRKQIERDLREAEEITAKGGKAIIPTLIHEFGIYAVLMVREAIKKNLRVTIG